MRGLFWFRNDLRLHDHPLLVDAASECDELMLLFILDPRLADNCSYGFSRQSERRKWFTIQGVEALRASISDRGGELITCVGHPEIIIPKIIADLKIEYLYLSKEIGTEEDAVVRQITLNAPTVCLKTALSGSLIHPDDLPFPQEKAPEVFNSAYLPQLRSQT